MLVSLVTMLIEDVWLHFICNFANIADGKHTATTAIKSFPKQKTHSSSIRAVAVARSMFHMVDIAADVMTCLLPFFCHHNCHIHISICFTFNSNSLLTYIFSVTTPTPVPSLPLPSALPLLPLFPACASFPFPVCPLLVSGWLLCSLVPGDMFEPHSILNHKECLDISHTQSDKKDKQIEKKRVLVVSR